MSEPALSYMLAEIHRMIPKQILQATFGKGGPNNFNGSSSIDKNIKEEVWINTLRDVNQISGKYKVIILDPNWRIRLKSEKDSALYGPGYYASAYRIPPEARDYGNIVYTEMVECRYANGGSTNAMYGGYGNNYIYTGNNATGLAAGALASRTLTPYNQEPRVYPLDNQTVKIEPDNIMFSSDLVLHCLVSFDKELTNCDVTLMNAIKDLFLCDTKIYIYNTLDIAINETEVNAGSEISRFKERVSEYADQMQERKELLAAVNGAKYYDPEILRRIYRYAV